MAAALALCTSAAAQNAGTACAGTTDTQRATWKTNALMLGVGHTSTLDTYLSPEHYRGADVRLMSHTRREKEKSAWISQLTHEAHAAYTDNRSGNGGEITADYTFRYTLLHRWNTSIGSRPLRLMAGAAAAADAGFTYNTRGTNNPANARLAVRIEPTIAVDLPVGRRSSTHGTPVCPAETPMWPVVMHYEASAPLAGLMFSPNYGQSYYEIFTRGNYDHNCVPTTIASTPSLRHMLTADIRIGRTTMRIGYLGTYEQTSVNRLKTHAYTHSLLIGLVRHFRTIKR